MKRSKKTKSFIVQPQHIKVLITVYDLNKDNKYPTKKGLHNILVGKYDPETRSYCYLRTFGTNISLQGRRLCSYVLRLVRNGYLTYIYDEASDEMYLKLTEKGIAEVTIYDAHHSSEYVKKEPTIKAQILEIKQ